jgi:hypothetical protein
MKRLTKKQRREYVDKGGVRCPFCGTENIEARGLKTESGAVWQDVTCLDCGEGWQDVYTLTDIDTGE